MAVQERGPESRPDAVPASSATAPVPARSGLATAGWRGARAIMARADRPAVPGLIMLLAATGFVLARWNLWARHSIGRFILIGENFAHPAQLPPGMPLRAAYGYDGQFFYRLAINPADFAHTAYGITVDQPYRFMRIGYPVITWLVSAGQRALVPWMLVTVNVAAIGALAWLGGHLARQGGRRVTGLVRRRSRPGRDDLAWFVPAAVFAAWQVVIYAVIGTFPLGADGGRNAGAPFVAPFEAVRYNLGHIDWSGYNGVDSWLAELAVLLVFAVAALCSLRSSRAPAHERLALVLFLVEICVVTPTTWSSRTADLRSFVEVYLMAVIVLLGRPRQPWRRRGAWLLPVATAWLLPVLGYVLQRRVHWS